MERFTGPIVHPQTWPEDLDYTGKTVIVIGSGATAATLIPAIADDCAHVTMLQRSPTYFLAGRNANELADTLRELEVDEEWIHEIVRRKILHDQDVVHPALVRGARDGQAGAAGRRQRHLGPDYDSTTHFTPTLSAVAPAHRLRARRRPVPGHQGRQGLGGHRRDRSVHRDGHPA